MTQPEPKKWFSAPEAAIFSGFARDTILRACRSGELVGHQRPGKKGTGKGGHWRIERAALEAWMRGEKAPVEIPAVTRRGSA